MIVLIPVLAGICTALLVGALTYITLERLARRTEERDERLGRYWRRATERPDRRHHTHKTIDTGTPCP